MTPMQVLFFEEEKPNVCFVNAMQVLHFEYLQSKFFL
jgi:hypothetical protein